MAPKDVQALKKKFLAEQRAASLKANLKKRKEQTSARSHTYNDKPQDETR